MTANTQPTRIETIKEKSIELVKTARSFFNSYFFYALETLIAVLIVMTRQEVYGAILFVGLLAVILLVCEDTLATTLPFLLVGTFTTNCYNSFDTFIKFVPFAPFVVGCLVFHFVVYHKPYSMGESAYGIGAIAVAILLGGVGGFSLMEYIKGAYYYLGLGYGMLIAYFAMKSRFAYHRNYDFKERFAVIMSLMGLLCVAMIGNGYGRTFLGLTNAPYAIGFSRNNVCTMLMFAMPFPLYLTKRSPYAALGTFLFFGAMCATTSRGGLLFGTLEFGVCALYWLLQDKQNLSVRIGFCMVAVGAVLLVLGRVVADVIVNRLLGEDTVEGSDRFVMALQALRRIAKNPLFGGGILDNTIVYAEYKKAGTMSWYHMMISQVVGSMGAVGILCYGFQIWQRFRLILRKVCTWSLVLGISYLGIFLMSQVNPGEFCPVPFQTLAVLLFILQEKRLDEDTLPLARPSEKGGEHLLGVREMKI